MEFNAKHLSRSKAKQGRRVSRCLTVVTRGKKTGVVGSNNKLHASFKHTSGRAFKEMRHDFAIKALEKPGLFKPRPYLYYCIRCKWTFRVNDRRGSVIAVDKAGQPLAAAENAKRIATFAEGSCPTLSQIAGVRGRTT